MLGYTEDELRAFQARNGDADAGMLKNAAITLLARAQRLLGLLAPADIATMAHIVCGRPDVSRDRLVRSSTGKMVPSFRRYSFS